MAERYKLKASQIGTAKKPGMQNDGAGLYLRTSKNLTQSWVFRYRKNGRLEDVGMGGTGDGSLSDARDLSDIARRANREGKDVRTAIKQTGGPVTFKDAATQYIEAHSPAWKNAKHVDQWTNTLTTYAYPTIGELPVEMVDTDHVIKILGDIWYTKTETASRVRMRIESVLSYAIAKKYRTGPNPALWRGNIDKLLPKQSDVSEPRHFPAIDYEDLPALYDELGDSMSAKALKFTILTACRTSEATGARWGEINGDLWIIPADRMKARRAHRVPLAAPAMAIIDSLDESCEWVFPGLKLGKPLSNMAMLKLAKEKRPGITVHGMRSAFKDWAAEETHHANFISEMALAHKIPSKTEKSYRRGDLLAKRRELMSDWADFVVGK